MKLLYIFSHEIARVFFNFFGFFKNFFRRLCPKKAQPQDVVPGLLLSHLQRFFCTIANFYAVFI